MPRQMDPEVLRWVALGALAVVAVAIFMTLRFVRRVTLRVVIVGALVGVAALAWVQRESLRDCVEDCDCSFFGYEITPPGCPRS